jgi:hypothetical protein
MGRESLFGSGPLLERAGAHFRLQTHGAAARLQGIRSMRCIAAVDFGALNL